VGTAGGSGNSLEDDEVWMLARTLEKSSSLTSLDLASTHLPFLRLFSVSHNLASSGNGLTAEDTSMLAKVLKRHTILTTLNLSGVVGLHTRQY